MNNKNIISNKLDLNWSTTFSYTRFYNFCRWSLNAVAVFLSWFCRHGWKCFGKSFIITFFQSLMAKKKIILSSTHLGRHDIQHNDTQHNAEHCYAECQLCRASYTNPLCWVYCAECHYAECNYAECRQCWVTTFNMKTGIMALRIMIFIMAINNSFHSA